ncbi:anti-sigma factor family protein [Frondihabitans cladoniiphilus]|uniref:Zf-HC2 domain-containing protein n=1 Tax=Frondihabitans cladoniiphilus TaxID=715785 RepID=A0ABP8VY25_9MICO
MTHDHESGSPEDDLRLWDAAYVLGSLTPAERLRYEEYLEEHPAARADVADLSGLPGLLGTLSTEEALELLDGAEPAGGVGAASGAGVGAAAFGAGAASAAASSSSAPASRGNVASLAAAVNARRRRRRLGGVLVAAASAVVLILGGFGLGGFVAGSGSGSDSRIALAAMTPTAGSSLTADVGLESKAWGTKVEWRCSYKEAWTEGSGSYDLVVTSDTGEKTVVATWEAIGGKATDLSAATAIPASSIREVSITVSGSTAALASRHF